MVGQPGFFDFDERLKDPRERHRYQVEPVDKGVDEADGIVGTDVIVDHLRQKRKLAAVESQNMRHARLYRDTLHEGIPTPSQSSRLSTRSARFMQ